jgi:endonuclease/exonuclease/phosphatase family metal-dependent hydrolase
VVALALLGLVGCSDDDDATAGADTTSAATAAGVTTTTAAAPSTTAAAPTTAAVSATTAAAAAPTVRLVSQNLLHGIACPSDSDRCHLGDRVDLFVRQLEAAGCPDLVSVQEANAAVVAALKASAGRCGGRYAFVWDDDPGLDREVVLSIAPVVSSRRFSLPGGFRTALWVRAATDVGLVDFVSTHLASSSDDRPCDATTCPPPCAVADRLNACQAKALLAIVADLADPQAVVVLGGDLNAKPDEPTIAAIRAAGFGDTHLLAGNRECTVDPGQCTSGRDDASLADLTAPSANQTERIDYLFVGGSRTCATAPPTGLFNGPPVVGDPTGLTHPSDHTGVQATLACAVDDAARQAAQTGATLPPAPTTTVAPGGGAPDAATAAAITEAFRNLFDGDVADLDVKLASLEDAELVRAYFTESYEALREIAARTHLRVDRIVLTTPDRATVTFALLLEGNVVVGPRDGEAVRVGSRWLVTRRTYCDLSTMGAAELPEPCR